MELSNECLREFQEAYEIDFGEQIALDEAREMLTRLVTFYELVSRLLPGEGNTLTRYEASRYHSVHGET
jgi:hypothetical protein